LDLKETAKSLEDKSLELKLKNREAVKEIEFLNSELMSSGPQIQDLESTVGKMRDQFKQKESETLNLGQSITVQEEKLTDLSQERRAMTLRIQNKKDETARLQEKVKFFSEACARLQKGFKKSAAKRAQDPGAQEIGVLNAKIRANEAQWTKLKKFKDRLAGQLKPFNLDFDKLTQLNEQYKIKLNDLNQQWGKKAADKMISAQQKTNLEMKKNKEVERFQTEMDRLKEKVVQYEAFIAEEGQRSLKIFKENQHAVLSLKKELEGLKQIKRPLIEELNQLSMLVNLKNKVLSNQKTIGEFQKMLDEKQSQKEKLKDEAVFLKEQLGQKKGSEPLKPALKISKGPHKRENPEALKAKAEQSLAKKEIQRMDHRAGQQKQKMNQLSADTEMLKSQLKVLKQNRSFLEFQLGRLDQQQSLPAPLGPSPSLKSKDVNQEIEDLVLKERELKQIIREIQQISSQNQIDVLSTESEKRQLKEYLSALKAENEYLRAEIEELENLGAPAL